MILNFQLNRTKKFNVFLAFLLITLNQFVECLYEDQIGKFDWYVFCSHLARISPNQ